MVNKAVYNYKIVSKPIDIEACSTREISRKLGISLSTIKKLVHDPDTKNLFSRFITISREKIQDIK